MSTKAFLDIVAWIAVVGVGVYQVYKSVKRLNQHLAGRKEFLETNKETLNEEFLEHKTWALIYVVCAVVLFVTGVHMFLKGDNYLYAVTCISLGFILLGFVIDSFVTRRSWYYETGFFFEYKFHRYRSLAHVGPRKGLIPTYDVRFHSNPDMVVTRKMGEKVLEKQSEWKKAKKEKK